MTELVRSDNRRFIPTCVGLMSMMRSPSLSMAVHPHVRGVNVCGLQRSGAILRFIPTCVGLITFCPEPLPPDSVHPHVRGVNLSDTSAAAIRDGSSPRAWG